MRIQWGVGDIVCGQLFTKDNTNKVWMIGRLFHEVDGKYLVIISQEYGLVSLPFSQEELAVFLSTGNYMPIKSSLI